MAAEISHILEVLMWPCKADRHLKRWLTRCGADVRCLVLARMCLQMCSSYPAGKCWGHQLRACIPLGIKHC